MDAWARYTTATAARQMRAPETTSTAAPPLLCSYDKHARGRQPQGVCGAPTVGVWRVTLLHMLCCHLSWDILQSRSHNSSSADEVCIDNMFCSTRLGSGTPLLVSDGSRKPGRSETSRLGCIYSNVNASRCSPLADVPCSLGEGRVW